MELLYILVVLGCALFYFYLKSPSVIGAAGERRVNAALRKKLPEPNYILLKDITFATADGTTQIDHIVLSRYGIFVIETKNMSGWIFGGERQARWTQVMRRHKSQFQNPLRQNYHHIKTVENLLGIEMRYLESLVIFAGSAKPKTEMPSNVFWRTANLVNYIAQQKTVHFTDREVLGFGKQLRGAALEESRETRRAHVRHVQDKVTSRGANITKCPRCGSHMIKRTKRQTGQAFYGCSQFPKCRGTL